MSIIKQSQSAKDVKIKNKILVHNGFCRIERYEMQHRSFDGNWTSIYTREFIAKPCAVAALPYDPRTDQVVLIEQLRVGALEKNVTPWLIEIVAGIMDHIDEKSCEEAIYREMDEEVCLEIEALLPLYDYFTSPGYSTEKIKLYCAKVDATKAPKFCGLKAEHEDIKIHVISTDAAFAAVRLGQINNGFAIIALQWLELNLKNLKEKWV